ncbi:MAG: thiamine phosphate synthase [Pseudomonadota bacterium]
MDLTPHSPAARALVRAARRRLRAGALALPPVLVLTDPGRSAHPLELARCMPAGWGLIYRHFGTPDRAEVAGRLAQRAATGRFTLLIGEDPELAARVGADGVHWRGAGGRYRPGRARAFRLNTMSAHRPGQVRGPQPAWIAARVLSAVYPSQSRSAGPPMGPVRFRLACLDGPIFVYGLGGIDGPGAGRLGPGAGAAGVGTLAPRI